MLVILLIQSIEQEIVHIVSSDKLMINFRILEKKKYTKCPNLHRKIWQKYRSKAEYLYLNYIEWSLK